jgi:hypothetical protein
MILVDQFGQNETINLNVATNVYIPRTGELVTWKYKPDPKVINVQYDFKEGVIYVALG